MIRPQLILDLHGELLVDNFAGGGGASTGIEMGLGRNVDIAINHNPMAVAMHAANHPQTHHAIEDVFAVDPISITKGRPVGGAWFSPDCTHFSAARGGKPKSKKVRGLAWVVLKWAVEVRPRVMFLENVKEFATWGPLLPNGQRDPVAVSRTFQAFESALTTGLAPDHPDIPEIHSALGANFPIERLIEGLRYDVQWRRLVAYEYGAGTIRERLFMIARCDGKGCQQSVVAVSLLKYYRTDQDPEITEPLHTGTTKARFGVSEASLHIPPLTPEREAMARIVAAFLREHGIKFEGEFATTRSGLVIWNIGMRMFASRELYRAQGFPEDYVIDPFVTKTLKNGRTVVQRLTKTEQIEMCGNSVCPPVAAAIVAANIPELSIWSREERRSA